MALFLGGILFLILGYILYGRLVEKIFGPDDRKTPAVKNADGADFVVLPRWKNMLIQLLNIAGIGPVIGVILGIKFGIIALVIIPIGCVLGGAVHDMAAGMMSIRDNGANLPKIVHKNLGKNYNVFFEWFMVILLLLVVAVFINIPANLINTTVQDFSKPVKTAEEKAEDEKYEQKAAEAALAAEAAAEDAGNAQKNAESLAEAARKAALAASAAQQEVDTLDLFARQASEAAETAAALAHEPETLKDGSELETASYVAIALYESANAARTAQKAVESAQAAREAAAAVGTAQREADAAAAIAKEEAGRLAQIADEAAKNADLLQQSVKERAAYEMPNYFWVAVIAIFLYYVIATMFPVDKIIGKVYPFFGLMLLVGTFAIFVALLIAGFKDPSVMKESLKFKENMWKPETHPVFPLLFVTIACGIISGFHATQSPIIARTMRSEREARSDFYGMMILEGIIAMIWAVGGLAIYNWDFTLPNPQGLMSKSGPVVLCAITGHFLGSWMGTITVLAVVILAVTSGDTALRSTRLSLGEMLRIPQHKFMPRFMTCLPLILLVAGLLYWSNTDATTFNKLWNYFAWGNQVLAATTLMAATVWLLRRGKKAGALVTLLPGMFMTAVVVSFIVWTSGKYGQPEGLFFFMPKGGLPYWTSVIIGAVTAVAFTVFAWRQGQKPDPLLDYSPSSERYAAMAYRHCGKTGLSLPRVSLGLWHNFGDIDDFDNARAMVWAAFDRGITHFDLANNYGPPAGSAEEAFGRILKADFSGNLRDEVIVSTKAGYTMWPGPYGDFGSRKSLIASCDQSLKRLGLDHVDIFYHHRMDPDTPIEESMLALDQIVRSGRALYVGISNYSTERAREAFAILRELKTPTVLHQVRYNMLDRAREQDGSFDVMKEFGVGGIIFSPMAQGLLSDRYLNGIPADSRMTREVFLKSSALTPEVQEKIRKLNEVAQERGQSLAAMAIAWVLRQDAVTSALVGASRPAQITDVLDGLQANPSFTAEELARIDAILR